MDPQKTFRHSQKKYDLTLKYTSSPNNTDFVNYLKKNKIDILIIMVGHILKKRTIEAVKLGIINKHSAMLPYNKGMFPFFWAYLYNTPQGITFHKIDSNIDEGKILLKKQMKNKYRSMISFYDQVFTNYPSMLMIAIEKAEKKLYLDIDKNSGYYFSLPTRHDYLKFKHKGGKIITFSDILVAFWRCPK